MIQFDMRIFFKLVGSTQPPTIASRIANWAASSRPSPTFPEPILEGGWKIVVEISKEMRHGMEKLHMGSGLDIKDMISSG